MLAHFTDFDPKYRVNLNANKQLVEGIEIELRKRRSPAIVYAISEDPSLDQTQLPLAEALRQVVGRGMGTVLSCIPGALAFVETEDERYILERHPSPAKPEYVRFVVGRNDAESGVELGIFHASHEALERGTITGADARQLEQLRAWFNENLEKPASFGRGRLSLGICWFKIGATEHIGRIRQIVQILERNGVFVKKLRTAAPGYVVYEDEWQLVAEPFRRGTLSK